MAVRKGVLLQVMAVVLILSFFQPMNFSVASSIGAAEAKVSSLLASLQTGVGGVLLLTSALLVRLIVMLIPGLAVLMLCWAGYRIYTTGSYNYRTFLGLGIALGLTCGLIYLGERFGTPPNAAQAELKAIDDQGTGIRSGELVLLQTGEVVLKPDPRAQAPGHADQGWQEALAHSIQMALLQGQEQVVLEFSRRGCAYCAKQLPVLQDVMRSRATGRSMAVGTAFVGGTSLALAPLRVFLLDAEEFPQLAKGFKVEAFPTLWVFGLPKVDPIIRQGFLEKPQLEEILQFEAMKRPPPEKKKGLLGRIFR